MSARALPTLWPRARLPWVELGDFPTPTRHVRGDVWVKRDDLSSPIYGGNKVRTLEALLGDARARGKRRIYATGAYGSNHAVATVLHAPRVGLDVGAILFPQPASPAALENCRVILAARPALVDLPHWSVLPFAIALEQARARDAAVMVPGGATVTGALAYVSAGLELALQVEAGELPAPERVVVGVGSTCTSAGLLLGLRAAATRGIGWRTPPRLSSVRVTPWPVTSAYRIVGLAQRTAARLAELTADRSLAFDRRALGAGLEVDGAQLGRGYGEPTEAGRRAIAWWREHAGFELDTTYSAKAAAAIREDEGPVVFWSTKSTAPLPDVARTDWAWAPRRIRRWVERAEAADLA